jgi:chromosome segregation ATPase
MAAISAKIKECLASLDRAGKALAAVDADCAELSAVGTLLDAKRNELAELEARLTRANEEFVKEDREHSVWRQASARERAKGNAEIDRLQERLRTLKQQVEEAEERHSNILAGISALHARLKVG